MSQLEDHMRDCEEMLNKPFKSVHLFLDQYAEVFIVSIFNEYHRTFLHNSAGLAVIEVECGKEAGIAAKIHLVRDYTGAHIAHGGLEVVKQRIDKVLMYFNNPENLKFDLNPGVVRAWEDKSLCQIAFGDGERDKCFRHISEY